MAFIDFPIRDEACKTPDAHHVGIGYFNYGNNNLYQQHFSLGNQPLTDPLEAIAAADKAAEPLFRNSWDKTSITILTAAASVLRICMRHEAPQLEVAVNAVAQTDPSKTPLNLELYNQLFPIRDSTAHDGWPKYNLYRGGFTAETIRSSAVDKGFGEAATALYLPQEHLEKVQEVHKGIYVDRGSYTNPVLVGLLGSEALVAIQPSLNSRPDY